MNEKIRFGSAGHEILISGRNRVVEGGHIESLHKSGEKYLERVHFSDTSGEKWKYTDIESLTHRNFTTTSPEISEITDKNNIKNIIPEYTGGSHIVIVNGLFSTELSTLRNSSRELAIISSRQNPDKAEDTRLPGTVAKPDNNSFLSLNTSLFQDCIIIRTSEGSIIDDPVHLTFVTFSNENNIISFPRIFIHTGRGSKINIVEEYIGVDESVYLNNPVTEILMENSSVLNHHKFQKEGISASHIGIQCVYQNGKSTFNSYLSSFGGALSRNEIYVNVEGKTSETHLKGIYMLNGSQHIDNHTEIFHMSPESSSSEQYHGILDDSSKAVFDGLIYVAKDADGTDSDQSNKSLLLSDMATVNSKPALEIYAEDVKCSHSATVGQMDEESLYYLRSRGISEKESVRILTTGFANEILDSFPVESVKKGSSEILLKKLGENKYE